MALPPSPSAPPLVQMLEWIARPMALMEACAKVHGDLFSLTLGKNFAPVVFVHHPQVLEEILSDSKHFEAPGEYNEIFQPLLGKHSVITASGVRHQRQRQLLMPPFHGERMRMYGQLIGEITQQVMTPWKSGQPFCVRASTQAIALRVILKAVFGLDDESPRGQQLEQLLSSMLEEMSSPFSAAMLYFPILQRDLGPLTPWGKFLRSQQQTDQLLYAEIQERREQPDSSRTDILSLLMAARDEAGEPMTDEELRDELMTLLVAGHETTATALAWALYWIHKLPEVREKLLQELDCLGDDPDPSAIFRLPYLNAVCCETLRIYPVAMLTFPRKVKVPLSLMGYELEPGTAVLGSIYLTHRREDLYPEPDQFKPERFLERQFSPFEYLPFGAGSRRCIGLAFAQFEMKVALANILSSVKLALADNREVRPTRRGLVTAPAGSIRLVVTGEGHKKEQVPQVVASTV